MCVPDYRGFGGSEGTPTEDGLIMDAAAAAAWLHAHTDPGTHVVLLGKSIGAAVALGLACEAPPGRPPSALVLQVNQRFASTRGVCA